MDFHIEYWDETFPYWFHIKIWKPQQHYTRQWRMGLSCVLEHPMLKHLKVKVYSDISHEQEPQVSR